MDNNFGTCELCGKEAELFTAGEIEICKDCIKEYYVSCDYCNEYYTKDDTIFYYLFNGKVYCEDCAIYAMNFSGLTEDNIEFICSHEEYEEDDEDEEEED